VNPRFPIAGDHIDWQVALAHYEAERLEEAHEKALEIGMGGHTQYLTWYRTIEAEALTAERSKIRLLRPNLELESIADELEGHEDRLVQTAIEAFQDVGHRFGYRHESMVKLAVLAAETDAPWLFGRFGYCIAKQGFYKICIPRHLAFEPGELFRTLQHEYGHVVVGTLSNRKAPRWIEEAVAMQAEGGVAKSQARIFATGQEEWLPPLELESDLRGLDESRDKWLAYLQAGLIGGYLAHFKGESEIGKMLRAFGSAGAWSEFWARLRGFPPEELPIRRTYRLSVDLLFEQAHAFVRAAR